jgi:hypothetical protein
MDAGSWVLNIDFGWPDERLGRTLLALSLEAEALAHGADPKQIPRDVAQRWVTQFAVQEASRVEDIPLEKARRLAALGSFTQAGAIFRAHMADRTLRVKDERDAAKACAHRAKLKENSKEGARVRRKYTEADRKQWRKLAAGDDLAGHSKRRRAELIALRLDLPVEAVETIRKAI